MLGFGFGFGQRHSRRGDFQAGHLSVADEISQHGVNFAFSQDRPVGQYANGDYWVVGPVTIGSITPAGSTQTIGSDGNSAAIIDRVINGTVINPGNRNHKTDGLTQDNTGVVSTATQGWDSITSGGGIPFVAYDADMNVDPGKTGSSLDVTSGSVVKFVSQLSGLPAQNRPAGLDMVVLTVVDAAPAAGAIRPGISRADKTSLVNVSQFDLSVFNDFAPTPNAPSFAEALDWIDRVIETSLPDSINNPTAKAINNHPEYGREIGNNLHRALLALHLDFTAEQKRTLLSHLAALADDLVARCEEGGITPDDGGGNQWKKASVAVCAAALGANAPASWLTYLSAANNDRWSEDRQIFNVSPFDVVLPRYTADGRPRSPYQLHMLRSGEWGSRPTVNVNYGGSNWDAFYRDIVAGQLLGGTLAVELTTGARALWDNDAFWRYMDTAWHRRDEFSAGNDTLPFVEEMLVAHRPAKTAVPAILEAGLRDDAIWIRFDQALDDQVTAPATGDFVVNVNGSPVTV
ncbi:MAG: hypothetical protein AAGD43_34515, partial [Pseudomonadota bacterium]